MYYLICNPTAGAGRSLKILQEVEQTLREQNKPYEIDHTEYAGHAKELASAAIGKGYTGILSVGGDGTLLEAAEALRGTNEVLGVIPAGTGNDFRSAIDVPKNPIEALKLIFEGHHRCIDVGVFNDDKCFLNVTGTGFDVDVIKNTLRVRKLFTGGLAYFCGIVLSLFGYKNATIDITSNNQTIRRTVLLIAVANGKCYGGGLKISPQSDVTDGQFNIVIINRVPKWRILVELPKLKRGDLDKITGLEHFTCSEVTIVSESPLHFNMDGDMYGQTPATMRIQKGALNVFCP